MLKLVAMLGASVLAWMAGQFLSAMLLLIAHVPDSYADAYAEIAGYAAFVASYVYLQRRAPAGALFPAHARPAAATILWSTAGALAAYLLLVGMTSAVHGRVHIHPHYDWTKITAAVFILAAAATEEALCRGYLYGIARVRLGTPAAVIAAALVFSLLHWPDSVKHPVEFLSQFVDAVALSMLTLRFGSLLPATITHALFNYCTGLTRLQEEAPLDHSGVFAYENGSPDAVFVVVKMMLALLVIVVLARQIQLRSQETPSARHEPYLAEESLS